MLVVKEREKILKERKRPNLTELQTISERMLCCHRLYHLGYA